MLHFSLYSGGNSKTAMIAALSPADINYDETLSTLRLVIKRLYSGHDMSRPVHTEWLQKRTRNFPLMFHAAKCE